MKKFLLCVWLVLQGCAGDINDPYVHPYRSTDGEYRIQFWGHSGGNTEQYDIVFYPRSSTGPRETPLAAGVLDQQNYHGFSTTLTAFTETVSWPEKPPTAPTSKESRELVGQQVNGKWSETDYYIEDRCPDCGGPVTLLPSGKMKLYDLELQMSGPPVRTLKFKAEATNKKKYE